MNNSAREFRTTHEDAGTRLDQFLTSTLGDVSRARVQQLIADNKVEVNGHAAKASVRLREPQRRQSFSRDQPGFPALFCPAW